MVFSCNWCKAFPSSAPLKFCYPLAVESMGLDRVYHFSEPRIIDDSKSSLVLQQPLKPTPIMPVSCTVTKSSISCPQFSVRIHAVRTTSLLYNCRLVILNLRTLGLSESSIETCIPSTSTRPVGGTNSAHRARLNLPRTNALMSLRGALWYAYTSYSDPSS